MHHKQRKAIRNGRTTKEVKQQIALMSAEGWIPRGHTAGGHYLLTHPSGAKVRIACTPSNHRTRLNELRAARTRVREAWARQTKEA